jgi:hypothetical protein
MGLIKQSRTAQGDESYRLPLLSVKHDSKKRDRHDDSKINKEMKIDTFDF